MIAFMYNMADYIQFLKKNKVTLIFHDAAQLFLKYVNLAASHQINQDGAQHGREWGRMEPDLPKSHHLHDCRVI